MGKHLSVEEKLNASTELQEIKAKLPELKFERGKLKYFLKNKYSEPYKAEFEARLVEIKDDIYKLQLREKQLNYYLRHAKKSKYKGLYPMYGVCYNLFGKKRCELTKEEARIYDRFMRVRAREKENADETH